MTAGDATEDDTPTVEEDIGKSREGSRTDDEAVQRYVHAEKLCLKISDGGESMKSFI